MKLFCFLFILTAGLLYLRKRDERWIHVLMLAIGWLPVVGLMAHGLALLTRGSQIRYDEWFLVSDQALGDPAFRMGRLLLAHPWLNAIATLDYHLFISIAFCVVTLALLQNRFRDAYRAFLAMTISCLAAGLVYAAMPASGPHYAFAGFPFHEPVIIQPAVLHLWAAPNCLPSNHLALALLCCAFVWRWRAGRIAGMVHVGLTVVSTLGLGEHYCVDLVAAVPYSMFCYWASGLAFRPHAKLELVRS